VKKYSPERLRWIADQCRARIEMSRSKMAQRYDQWAANEELFSAYVPETEADTERKWKRDNGEPQYTTLHIPYSYAIAMTAHTYYTSVFLARNPILQLSGRHGEGEQQVQAVEALLDYQLQVGEMLVPLFLWLFDPIKYGFGVVGHYWDEEQIRCRKWVKQPKQFLGMPIPGTEETVEIVEDIVGYAGHRCFNVRPQDCFPDPRVSIWNFQRGKFFGRYVEIPYEDALAGEVRGKYFGIAGTNPAEFDAEDPHRDVGSSSVRELPGESDWFVPGPEEVPKFLKCYELYVRLIPKDWKLADSDREEIWVFTLVAGSYRVIGVQPLGLYHGKFPFDVIEQEPEAYDFFSRSMMEVMEPLNEAINWMVNSHMFNVRSALNNMFAVDPSMVVMKDLENPEPGKLIRLKPAAYGRDIRQFMAQFPVQDVTSGHVPNMQLMAEMLQRVTGVTDNVMGLVNQGGRKTATEVRQSTTMGINRLKTSCEFFSVMGFSPFTQKLVQGSQQHYSMERQFKIVGDLAAFSDQFVNVTPEMIAGFYDFVPVDGSMPIDRFAQANLWQMMLGQMSKVPQVMQQYDLGKMFGWVANLAGLRNLQKFRVQITDPALLAAQQQAGNIVPLKQNTADLNRPPAQMQVPGMGATG
jgi:hypothetical protein